MPKGPYEAAIPQTSTLPDEKNVDESGPFEDARR